MERSLPGGSLPPSTNFFIELDGLKVDVKMKKKRIFPAERIGMGIFFIICSLLFSVLCIYAAFYAPYSTKKFEVEFLIAPVTVIFSLIYITAHTTYDSEKLVSWTLYHKKTVRFKNIISIRRKWVNCSSRGSKSARLYWHVIWNDGSGKKDKYTRIFLPANPNHKVVKTLIESIKKVKPNVEFINDFDTIVFHSR